MNHFFYVKHTTWSHKIVKNIAIHEWRKMSNDLNSWLSTKTSNSLTTISSPYCYKNTTTNRPFEEWCTYHIAPILPLRFYLYPQNQVTPQENSHGDLEEVQEAVTLVLNRLPSEDYQGWFESWEQGWNLCVELRKPGNKIL